MAAMQVCEPFGGANWLYPRLLMTVMGSDLADKQELGAAVLAPADCIVCDRESQCFSMGVLQCAAAEGLVDESSVIDELGELTSGRRPGRESDAQITVCDLTGTGVQDTAIATAACRKAREKGLGTAIGV